MTQANAIAVDGAGNAYVTGDTLSTNFPTTAGAAQTTHAGGDNDAFVTTLDATGSGLVYSTYLGGSGLDWGNGIAVDGAGAYVTGYTASTNFPTTAGAFQTTRRRQYRCFCGQDSIPPAHVNGPVQARRLEDLWRLQESRRLRELCCDQRQEPAFPVVARISGAAGATGPRNDYRLKG